MTAMIESLGGFGRLGDGSIVRGIEPVVWMRAMKIRLEPQEIAVNEVAARLENRRRKGVLTCGDVADFNTHSLAVYRVERLVYEQLLLVGVSPKDLPKPRPLLFARSVTSSGLDYTAVTGCTSANRSELANVEIFQGTRRVDGELVASVDNGGGGVVAGFGSLGGFALPVWVTVALIAAVTATTIIAIEAVKQNIALGIQLESEKLRATQNAKRARCIDTVAERIGGNTAEERRKAYEQARKTCGDAIKDPSTVKPSGDSLFTVKNLLIGGAVVVGGVALFRRL